MEHGKKKKGGSSSIFLFKDEARSGAFPPPPSPSVADFPVLFNAVLGAVFIFGPSFVTVFPAFRYSAAPLAASAAFSVTSRPAFEEIAFLLISVPSLPSSQRSGPSLLVLLLLLLLFLLPLDEVEVVNS